ncbi:unnamed protein product [Heligmosomoides polygyrus]|uniref:PPIase cyclophilin-type domain-containing protein n=1 Tax=Heligmosomoides polygyrus TaxID=6339 RepID=A0A183GT68_HELPZ|nr:unnamed protein product [Heligmosomoides polygyrus]
MRKSHHPSAPQYGYEESQHRSSHRDLRIDSKGVTAVSRPGSPGPVAGAGDVVNTPHGFTIQLDVKLFHPEQIKETVICFNRLVVIMSTTTYTVSQKYKRILQGNNFPPSYALGEIQGAYEIAGKRKFGNM